MDAEILCIDKGDICIVAVKELYELPDDLKNIAPQVVEIYLVDLKPIQNASAWSRFSYEFAREKILNKELDGRIVLALSSTLWLNPLCERKRPEGMKDFINVFDIRKELIDNDYAENYPGHLSQLYDLCRAGGVQLADSSCGLVKVREQAPAISYAFLRADEQTEVYVSAVYSPRTFYVRPCKSSQSLKQLEKDIQSEVMIEVHFKISRSFLFDFCCLSFTIDFKT